MSDRAATTPGSAAGATHLIEALGQGTDGICPPLSLGPWIGSAHGARQLVQPHIERHRVRALQHTSNLSQGITGIQ